MSGKTAAGLPDPDAASGNDIESVYHICCQARRGQPGVPFCERGWRGGKGSTRRSKGSALAEWVVSALMQVCLLTRVFGPNLNAAALGRHFAGRS